MKNTFEESIKFLRSSDFEFIGLDEERNEILYICCENEYEEIYKTSLEFAARFISVGCDSLAVKSLFLNEIVLHIYKSELTEFGGYNKYAIACQIIAAVVEEYI